MYCIITTINFPTKAIEKLYEKFGSKLIIVADRKTPPDWNYKGLKPLWFESGPHNHYARKNLGYLEAMRRGAKVIYDTDDDNIPNNDWGPRKSEIRARISEGTGWHNVYKHFTQRHIWPRGFPLNMVNDPVNFEKLHYGNSSIQQGICDDDPDVDAIWRMTNGENIKFYYDRSIYLDKNTWCPFNSQSTWWFPKAYPLMYLPQYCTFRMTDIWRSFVAQRCLWELGEGVTFHSPAEVYQERNPHDLMKDFEDEIPGYLHNAKIAEALNKLTLDGGVCYNMSECYKEMVRIGVLPKEELNSLKEWISDIRVLWK